MTTQDRDLDHDLPTFSSPAGAADAVVTHITHLPQLGVLMVTGPDARSYLQGQLTVDLDKFQSERVQLTCCNSPQGRVQAVMWMIGRSDGIALLLPATMIDSTLARLRKYVLRAKTKIEVATHLQVGALPRTALPAEVTLANDRDHRQLAAVSFFNLPAHDDVVVLGPLALASDADNEHRWTQGYLRAGLPQVYPETHEAFVAQMLNIDLLGGVSFEKGCYTGQEIIARTHFRGMVKRRMFLFQSAGSPPPRGARVLAGEQHAGDVVDAVATENGCELLAVISLAQLDNELQIDGRTEPLHRMQMPYSLVER